MTNKRIVVGVTGASGAPYLIRFLQLILASDIEVHLTISDLGRQIGRASCRERV